MARSRRGGAFCCECYGAENQVIDDGGARPAAFRCGRNAVGCQTGPPGVPKNSGSLSVPLQLAYTPVAPSPSPCEGRMVAPAGHGSTMLKRLKEIAAGGVFDPYTARILTAAFDDAWKSVQESGVTFPSNAHADATREILALRIIEMAQLGERDQRRLRDDALLHLAQSNLRSSGL
jgi:hypothetical protein